MPDTSSVVVIPNGAVTIYIQKQAGQTVNYSNLNGLTYATLAADTYGQLQNLGNTNGDIVVIPTGTATIFSAKERTLANYLSIAASWGTTYLSITGLSYGQLDVVP